MKKRKWLSILLAVVMVMALVPATVFAADGNVAKIGNQEYATVQAAIEGTTGDQTIELIANSSESITIPAGRKITLNLGGFTLSEAAGNDTIANKGGLVITGSGKVQNTSSGKGALVNYPGATATLNGGTFTADKWYTIKNLGTMSISAGVTVTTPTGGSSLIDNGWYGNAGNDRNTTYEGTPAKLTITGGTFNGGMNTVKNDDYGDLVISDGTFENTNGPAILNWNTTSISGGDFSVPNGHVVANGYLNDTGDQGKLTVTGGSFTSGNNGTDNLFGYGVGSAEGGQVSINGGEFTGTVGGDNYYDVVVNSGAFSSAVPASYIAGDAISASLTSNGDATYYIGTATEVAQTLAEKAAEGDSIEVYQGDLSLDNIAGGVTVKNSGNGTVTVDDEPVTDDGIVTHTHSFGQDWKSDKTNHWHECSCGEKEGVAAHTFGEWTVTKKATATEKGSKERVCSVCGYKETAEIPVAEGSGSEGSGTDDTSNIPQTGESSDLTIWFALFALAAAGITGTALCAKKRKA